MIWALHFIPGDGGGLFVFLSACCIGKHFAWEFGVALFSQHLIPSGVDGGGWMGNWKYHVF